MRRSGLPAALASARATSIWLSGGQPPQADQVDVALPQRPAEFSQPVGGQVRGQWFLVVHVAGVVTEEADVAAPAHQELEHTLAGRQFLGIAAQQGAAA
jgi:hypothetical protein